jgi:hypothetical protein
MAGMPTRLAVVVAVLAPLLGADFASAQDTSFGQRLYQDKADCQFCHGVNGDGRGDPRSPGKAPDLHQARLDREQLIEVIACSRPGSEENDALRRALGRPNPVPGPPAIPPRPPSVMRNIASGPSLDPKPDPATIHLAMVFAMIQPKLPDTV